MVSFFNACFKFTHSQKKFLKKIVTTRKVDEKLILRKIIVFPHIVEIRITKAKNIPKGRYLP